MGENVVDVLLPDVQEFLVIKQEAQPGDSLQVICGLLEAPPVCSVGFGISLELSGPEDCIGSDLYVRGRGLLTSAGQHEQTGDYCQCFFILFLFRSLVTVLGGPLGHLLDSFGGSRVIGEQV